jgi:CRISPR-associated endonuclease/helicase Cas3
MYCGVESLTEDSARFWAKTTPDGRPGISVRDHCLNVGCVAAALANTLPPSLKKLLPDGGVTLAALHDVGKITPGFQRQCPAWFDVARRGGLQPNPTWGLSCTSHSLVSQWHLETETLPPVARRWAQAVGAHHGRVIRESSRPQFEAEHEVFKGCRERHVSWLVGQFGPVPQAAPADEAVLCLLAGLASVADWIGSDEHHFPLAACRT